MTSQLYPVAFLESQFQPLTLFWKYFQTGKDLSMKDLVSWGTACFQVYTQLISEDRHSEENKYWWLSNYNDWFCVWRMCFCDMWWHQASFAMINHLADVLLMLFIAQILQKRGSFHQSFFFFLTSYQTVLCAAASLNSLCNTPCPRKHSLELSSVPNYPARLH